MTPLPPFLIALGGWLRIVLFPVLIAIIISIVIYLNSPDIIGVAAAALLCFAAFVIGVVMATRIWKKRGTSGFASSIQAEDEAPLEEEDRTETL